MIRLNENIMKQRLWNWHTRNPRCLRMAVILATLAVCGSAGLTTILGTPPGVKLVPSGNWPGWVRGNANDVKVIDNLADGAASVGDRASRKSRLLKGPEEFREARVDRPKARK